MGKGNSKQQQQQQQPSQQESSISFKGTFIAVMVLGIFILATWFGSYALFISR